MPAQPVDAHSEEFDQLAGLAALDVLEGGDRMRFEQHAATCERCQLTLRLDRQALAHISLVAAPMDPSPDFKARLMERASAELAAAAEQAEPADLAQPVRPVRMQPTPIRALPRNVVPLWRRSPWVSALAAVLVVGLVSLGTFTFENQPVATYELSGSTPGKAVVVVRRSGATELQMDGVPDPGPGFLYEAWIIAPGGQPVAAGTTASGQASVALPNPRPGTTIAITKERGPATVPTPPILMSTVVES